MDKVVVFWPWSGKDLHAGSKLFCSQSATSGYLCSFLSWLSMLLLIALQVGFAGCGSAFGSSIMRCEFEETSWATADKKCHTGPHFWKTALSIYWLQVCGGRYNFAHYFYSIFLDTSVCVCVCARSFASWSVFIIYACSYLCPPIQAEGLDSVQWRLRGCWLPWVLRSKLSLNALRRNKRPRPVLWLAQTSPLVSNWGAVSRSSDCRLLLQLACAHTVSYRYKTMQDYARPVED